MKTLKLEYLKLKKKTRSWLGPILVFWLIMIAYPLTVEFLQDKLEIGFFFSFVDSNTYIYDACN